MCCLSFFSSNGPSDSVRFSRAVVTVVTAGQRADGCCAACFACQRRMFSYSTDGLDEISYCGTLMCSSIIFVL